MEPFTKIVNDWITFARGLIWGLSQGISGISNICDVSLARFFVVVVVVELD